MATAGAIVAILVFIGLAVLAGQVAQRKGRPFWVYVLAGLIVGPVALIAAVVLPKRRLGGLPSAHGGNHHRRSIGSR